MPGGPPSGSFGGPPGGLFPLAEPLPGRLFPGEPPLPPVGPFPGGPLPDGPPVGGLLDADPEVVADVVAVDTCSLIVVRLGRVDAGELGPPFPSVGSEDDGTFFSILSFTVDTETYRFIGDDSCCVRVGVIAGGTLVSPFRIVACKSDLGFIRELETF